MGRLVDIGIVVKIRELWAVEGRAALGALTIIRNTHRSLASFSVGAIIWASGIG